MSPESSVIAPPTTFPKVIVSCMIEAPLVRLSVTLLPVEKAPVPIMLVLVLTSELSVIVSVPLFTIPFAASEFMLTFPDSVPFASAEDIFSTAPSVCAVLVIFTSLYVSVPP